MIKCGQAFTIMLTDILYGFGNTGKGQLCIGRSEHRIFNPTIISIDNVGSFSCGSYHTIVSTKDTVYEFRSNYNHLMHSADVGAFYSHQPIY